MLQFSALNSSVFTLEQPEYLYIFDYQLFVVNTVEKWLGFHLDTENKVKFNVFNFIFEQKQDNWGIIEDINDGKMIYENR